MTDILYFSRDTKVYIEIGTDFWEIPVLDGFSFSQATNTTEISINEMENSLGVSRRGKKMFNDSYAPAEWSFSTYARPFISAGTGAGAADDVLSHHAIEEVLWAMMVGDAVYTENVDPGFHSFTGVQPSLTDNVIDFADSNKSTLGTATLHFVLGACEGSNEAFYQIQSAVVDTASIDFDIDGIATINWSGFGSIITEEATGPTATVYEGIVDTNNYIRNRLTSLAITGTGTGNFEATYDITLTGGNITISNNLTFLTPETLCAVNQPIGHVTGTRSIDGNFTCYLNGDTVTDDHSMDLWEDLIESTTVVTNVFGLDFSIGGAAATPRLELNMVQCHLEVPTHSLDDVVSLDVAFHALGSTIDATDELVVTYVGA
jgi:hypothetical protein